MTTTITRTDLTDDELGDCVAFSCDAYGHAVLDQLVQVDEIVAFLSRLGTTTTTVETDPVSWQLMARDAAAQRTKVRSSSWSPSTRHSPTRAGRASCLWPP